MNRRIRASVLRVVLGLAVAMVPWLFLKIRPNDLRRVDRHAAGPPRLFPNEDRRSATTEVVHGGVEAEFDVDDYAREAKSARREVLQTGLATLVIALVLAVGLEFELNLTRTLPTGHWQWNKLRLETNISAADATVVVLGLVTVAAALSIAVATATVQAPSSRRAREFAAASIWAEQTARVSQGSSIIAVVAAVTRFLEPPSRGEIALGVLLSLIALLGVWLASSVTSWTGSDLLQSLDAQVDLSRLIARGEARGLELAHYSARVILRGFALFCALIAATTWCLLELGVEVARLVRGNGLIVPQWGSLSLLLWTVPLAVTTCLLAQMRWQEELTSRRSSPSRYLLEVFFYLVLTLIFVSVLTQGDVVLSLFAFALILLPLVFAWIALVLARRQRWSPAAWAVQIQIRAACKERDRLSSRIRSNVVQASESGVRVRA